MSKEMARFQFIFGFIILSINLVSGLRCFRCMSTSSRACKHGTDLSNSSDVGTVQCSGSCEISRKLLLGDMVHSRQCNDDINVGGCENLPNNGYICHCITDYCNPDWKLANNKPETDNKSDTDNKSESGGSKVNRSYNSLVQLLFPTAIIFLSGINYHS